VDPAGPPPITRMSHRASGNGSDVFGTSIPGSYPILVIVPHTIDGVSYIPIASRMNSKRMHQHGAGLAEFPSKMIRRVE